MSTITPEHIRSDPILAATTLHFLFRLGIAEFDLPCETILISGQF